MAFSKMRSMTPLRRSSVSMASCVTCFISCWNIWGVSLFRMERTLRNRSWRGEGTEKTKNPVKFSEEQWLLGGMEKVDTSDERARLAQRADLAKKERRPNHDSQVPGFCCHQRPPPLGPSQPLPACYWVSRPSLLCSALYLRSLTLWQ